MRWILPLALTLCAAAACGPTAAGDDNENCPGADLQTDVHNCGSCGTNCQVGEACIHGSCESNCTPGDQIDCYDGTPSTKDVGPCRGGKRTCLPSGQWGDCAGEVVPAAEICGNGVDENCSGQADENTDLDGDGFTTCDGDCCDSSECGSPALVNPGAFEAPGNLVDDDCDGTVDNAVATLCDQGLSSRPTNLMDYAKALDLCKTTTDQLRTWGVISATLSKADGQPGQDPDASSIRQSFGSGLPPLAGQSYVLLSSGHAAGKGQLNPDYVDFEYSSENGVESGFPADFIAAHGGTLPNAPNCPAPISGRPAQDPVMLTLRIRAPSNAKSFSFSADFFSSEFPEYTCSPYNDFFVVLLDSMWNGNPANPSDKNLAFYRNPAGMTYPVGVNLASGNTGLFTQCLNGTTGCFGTAGSISTCMGTQQLANTGFDTSTPDECDANSIEGGGTGWLTTSGNVKGGEVFTLRIAIWDTSDQMLDSLVVLDNFQWSVDASDPGTVIGRTRTGGAHLATIGL